MSAITSGSSQRSTDYRTGEHISFTQVRSFTACPLKWQLGRQYPPEYIPSGLVFGGAFHRGLQCYYNAQLHGIAIGVEEMMQSYHAHWEDEKQRIKFADKDSSEELTEKAEKMFAAYLAQVRPSIVLAAEEPFRITIGKNTPPVVGSIDLVEVCHDGNEEYLHLVDFKTSARRPTDSETTDWDQLLLYHIAIRQHQVFGNYELPIKLEYRTITKTKSPAVHSQVITPQPQQLENLIHKLHSCWQAMKLGLVWRNRSWMCSSCGYERLCGR